MTLQKAVENFVAEVLDLPSVHQVLVNRGDYMFSAVNGASLEDLTREIETPLVQHFMLTYGFPPQLIAKWDEKEITPNGERHYKPAYLAYRAEGLREGSWDHSHIIQGI